MQFKNLTLNPMHKKSEFIIYLISISLVLLNIGCSSTEEGPDERLLEKELYDQAQDRLSNENFATAIISLETLEARFPFGRYAEQAQAELIYAYYRNYQYEAANSAAERFANLHPRHPHTDYAYYLRGLAAFTNDSGLLSRYMNTDLSKRDVTQAQISFDNLSEFISRFPKSEYVEHATQRMIYLKNLLAQHEINVAEYYLERRAYIAAVGRAKYVLEHLPKTPQTPEALNILMIGYRELGQQDLSDINKEILEFNYPDYNIISNSSRVSSRSWLNTLSFGLFGEKSIPRP
jgi:outer membrane protein assembly factor BamD